MNRTLLAKVTSIAVGICALGLTDCAVGSSSGNTDDGGMSSGGLGVYVNPVDNLVAGVADENTVNVTPSESAARGVIRE